MKKKLISLLTYNYFAQKILFYLGIFKLRKLYLKSINYFAKNIKLSEFEFLNSNKINHGWSIIFLTNNLNINTIKKILEYSKVLKKKKFELIIITSFNKKKLSHDKIKVINLNTNKITLGKKRNLGIKISKYDKLIMSLDYFQIKNIKIDKLEKELNTKQLLVPKIKTKDNKRYLDWMFLDFPKIGKCFCPYNLKDRKYMYFHGSYFIFKRKYLIQNKFSDYLDHRQGEDVEWSLRVRKKIKYSLTDSIHPIIERFSYESNVLNDKYFKNNNKLLKKHLNVK